MYARGCYSTGCIRGGVTGQGVYEVVLQDRVYARWCYMTGWMRGGVTGQGVCEGVLHDRVYARGCYRTEALGPWTRVLVCRVEDALCSVLD